MIRLLLAEFRRIAARRLVRWLLALIAVGALGGGALAFITTGSLSETAYRQRVQAAQVQEQQIRDQAQSCIDARQPAGSTGRPDDATLKQCMPKTRVTAHDPRFHRSRFKGVLQGVSGALVVVTWLVGASLVGAEYPSRSMTTTLTFEPRRLRLFAAKAFTAVVFTFLVAAASLLLMTIALLPAAAFHGAPATGEPGVAELAGVALRGVALAGIACAIGFSIASIGRNTAAALAAGFAYIIVLENIIGASTPRWRRWLLLGNTIVFISGSSSESDVPGRTATQAGLLLGGVAVVWLIGASAAFRARDLA